MRDGTHQEIIAEPLSFKLFLEIMFQEPTCLKQPPPPSAFTRREERLQVCFGECVIKNEGAWCEGENGEWHV